MIMKKLFLIVLSVWFVSCKEDDAKAVNSINESKYLDLNGTKQFVMIRGENDQNPVLLHLHGGPGVSEIGGLRKYNKDLEKNFTVIYWDQRNAGKSYTENFPAAEIKVQKYVEDVNQLAKYLKDRLKVNKIFLVGHSWGSQLGMLAVQKYPQHFSAFVGTGQQVAAYEGELQSYRYTLAKAKEFKVDSLIQQLQFIGEPKSGDFSTMYPFPEAFSLQKYILLELNRKIYNGFPIEKLFANFQESDEYTAKEKENYLNGANFANEHIIKDPDYNNFDLRKQVPEVKIPVFFIAGKFDFVNPTPLAKEYFDLLKAPKKEFISFEKSGHDPAWEEPERYHSELNRIYKLIK
jgi:pimeloyl-ACP methyl ester carboxylesterase